MNRQIYGFTLFVFIVKVTFLLSWLPFAPIEMFRVVGVAESEPQISNFSESKSSAVKLESVSVNAAQSSVAALLTVSDDQDWFKSPMTARLNILDENSQIVWSEETQLDIYLKCRNAYSGKYNSSQQSAHFKKISNSLKQLDLSKNYRAQIEILKGETDFKNPAVYEPSDLQQVLIAHDK